MVGHGVRRAEPPLRLTRRGRAVVLVLLAVLASVASAVLFTTASRADDPPGGPAATVVVQPGDTLWSIATGVMPRRDGRDAVAELRRVNGLDRSDIQPGMVLILPRER